jgi:hypothetical protein
MSQRQHGGLAGSIQYGGVAIALRQGYAAASTDDGTAGDIPGFLLDTNIISADSATLKRAAPGG